MQALVFNLCCRGDIFKNQTSILFTNCVNFLEWALLGNILKQEVIYKLIFVIISTIIIALPYIIFFQKNISQKRKLEKYKLLISHLHNRTKIKEEELKRLQTIIDKKKDDDLKQQYAMDELFLHRFSTIDRLCSAYYEYKGTADEKYRIYKDVMKLVSELSTNKIVLLEMENFINGYKNNLMIRFRNCLPEIKEADCILYMYTVVGFSSRSISILINEKIEVVYNRKSRLKQKINHSSLSGKEEFINYLL